MTIVEPAVEAIMQEKLSCVVASDTHHEADFILVYNAALKELWATPAGPFQSRKIILNGSVYIHRVMRREHFEGCINMGFAGIGEAAAAKLICSWLHPQRIFLMIPIDSLPMSIAITDRIPIANLVAVFSR